MANVPVSNMTATWTDSGTTYNAVKMNVTDTASNAASNLMELQVGGASKFRVSKGGTVSFGISSGFQQSFVPSGNTSFDIKCYSTVVGGFAAVDYPAGLQLGSASSLMWNTGAGVTTVAYVDLYLARDTANTLAQRNATNPQTFNIYNTYTTTTNYERGFLKWNTNVLQIGTEKGSGGGTARDLAFQTDGTTRLTISSLGSITSAAGYALQPAAPITWLTRGEIYFNADGVAMLRNNAGTDFGRLQFGGTTSSFPALKRSATTLQVRLADDSAFAPLEVSTLTTSNAYTVATLPAAGVAGRRAYVTDATAPTFLGALTGGGAVKCPVFDNGTAWVAG